MSVTDRGEEQILRTVGAAMGRVLGVGILAAGDDFFEASGDSTGAIEVVIALRKELGVPVPIDAVQLRPTPHDLAQWLTTSDAPDGGQPVPVPASAGPRTARLSPVQQAIHEAMRLWEPVGVYNLGVVYGVSGPVDVEWLAECFRRASAYHEAVRTVLTCQDAAPALQVRDDAVPLVDVGEDGQEDEPVRERIVAFLRAEAVPTGRSPVRVLLSGRCPKDGETEYRYLAVSACHLVIDGETLGGYLNTVAALYGPASAAPAAWRLAQPPALRTSNRNEPHGRDRWTRLAGQRPRSDYADTTGRRQTLELGPDLSEALRTTASRHSATPYETVLALLSQRLGRDTEGPVTFGGAYRSGFTNGDTEHYEGQLVSLRRLSFGRPEPDDADAAIDRAKLAVRAAMSASSSAVTDEAPPVVVSVQDGAADRFALDGLRVEPLDICNGTARFEMAILLHLNTTRPRITVEYLRQCFEERAVAGFLADLRELLVRHGKCGAVA